ncbi:MAG TPA: ABC transporter ATP-binding protein [Aestuariivirgaceae bacterium]|nr:ABC transporter ATP-binding protein [Aestuariivirgaceae bacterium]
MTGDDETNAQDKLAWGPRGTAAATFAAGLSFVDVSLTYATVDAVRGVSFDLRPGEVACLLGPSGCGKTTLLRIAAGVERPDRGRVLLAGEEVAGPHRFVPPEKRGVGLMFQDYALFPHMTNVDNVAYGLKSLSRKDAREEARLALRRVGLADYADGFPWELSGGEQQRVALARAMVPRPAIILMDEPFSGLDQRLRDRVRRETLALLKETRATALIVTHDPIEAMELADRIFLMRQGRLVQQGSPRELYHHPVDASAARFFSEFNEFRARVEGDKVKTPFGPVPAGAVARGLEAVVMIRPRGLRLAGESEFGTRGRIVEARFLGDELQLGVVFEGFDEPWLARVAARQDVKIGATLKFAADPAHVFVFEA